MFADHELSQLEQQLVSPDAKKLASHVRDRLKKLVKRGALTEAKRDVLVFMLGLEIKPPCAPEQRPTVHAVLSKSFFLEAVSAALVETAASSSDPTHRAAADQVPPSSRS